MSIFTPFKIRDKQLAQQIADRLAGTDIANGRIPLDGDMAQIVPETVIREVKVDTYDVMSLIDWHMRFGGK